MLLGKLLVILAFIIGGVTLANLLASEIIVGQVSVIDGDTLEIGSKRVRLFGVDAMESSQLCVFNGRKWPCGRRAAFALADHVKDGTVTCRPTGKKSYDRFVARCFRGTEDIGSYMVRQGWALAATDFSQDYVRDQSDAQSNLRGIWSSTFIPPWTYRAQQRAKD